MKNLQVFLVLLGFVIGSFTLRRKVEAVQAQNCWKYQCRSYEEYCLQPFTSNKTYVLSTCPLVRPFCDTSNMQVNSSCSSITQESLRRSYPGEPCSDNSECEFGYCLGSICFGLILNEDCESNLECNPGLRCKSGKCTTLLHSGSPCESDYDCIPSLGCNNQKCTAYYSLPSGSSVSDCNNGDMSSLFCSESSCHYDSKSKQGTCIPAFKSISTNPICSNSSQCIGQTYHNENKYTKTSSCDCGMNEEGKLYCFPHDGDSVAVEFRKWWKRFISLGYLNLCNTERRFELACFDISVQSYFYVKMLKSYYDYYNFPQLYKSPSCVKSIFYQVVGFSKQLSLMLTFYLMI
jgi:hypothetical protein